MNILIQPDHGLAPIASAIRAAKKSVEIVIFRCDRREIEAELRNAIDRGVFVYALIASSNHGGEDRLRALEMRLLEAGATVARTAHDLARYHDKMLIVDRRRLYVLSFNYTAADIEGSRGFGIVTENRALVQQAVRLFEADTKRVPFSPDLDAFLVSPINARKQLARFLQGARRELLIYDPRISDPQMLQILSERRRAGVDVKIIGTLGKHNDGLVAQKLASINLHTRTIIRDREQAYMGSGSLRKAELDARRELGLLVNDPKVVRAMIRTFESDWRPLNVKQFPAADGDLPESVKLIVEELPIVTTAVKQAVKKVVADAGPDALADKKVQDTLKRAVKRAVKETIREVAEQNAEEIKIA